MGVQKFRSIEEMGRAPVEHRSAPEFERLLRHAARFAVMTPRQYPRGVFKFRTIDEARAARQKR